MERISIFWAENVQFLSAEFISSERRIYIVWEQYFHFLSQEFRCFERAEFPFGIPSLEFWRVYLNADWVKIRQVLHKFYFFTRRELIRFVDSGDVFTWKGVLMSILFLINNLATSILLHWWLFTNWNQAMRARTLVNALVYRKASCDHFRQDWYFLRACSACSGTIGEMDMNNCWARSIF